jgi:integrase
MRTSSPSTPSLRRHRPSGLAVVTLDGKDHYLGPWPAGEKRPPSPTQVAYDRLVAEWLANGRHLPAAAAEEEALLSVNELILAFWRHAEQHYRHEDGTPTSELADYRLSLRPLRKLYGTLPVAEFSPLKLKAVRQKMIDSREYRVRRTGLPADAPPERARWLGEALVRRGEGRACIGRQWRAAEILEEKPALSRGVINQRVGRIVRMFKWGVGEELVPETVYRSLAAVRGLEKGRSKARETEPVKPVPVAHVEAVLPYVLPPVAAMIRLQLLTGARPGELCIMRGCDLDVSGPVWLYRPASHKTKHRGKKRLIPLGPQGQAVVKEFLKSDTSAYLFSPRAAVEVLRELRRKERKSKVQPSQRCRKKRRPKRVPGERYDTMTYDRAVARACVKAGVPHWHPHQLRHTHATEVRRRYGLEAAQVALGHSQATVTEIYAERDLGLALKVAAEIG